MIQSCSVLLLFCDSQRHDQAVLTSTTALERNYLITASHRKPRHLKGRHCLCQGGHAFTGRLDLAQAGGASHRKRGLPQADRASHRKPGPLKEKPGL